MFNYSKKIAIILNQELNDFILKQQTGKIIISQNWDNHVNFTLRVTVFIEIQFFSQTDKIKGTIRKSGRETQGQQPSFCAGVRGSKGPQSKAPCRDLGTGQ